MNHFKRYWLLALLSIVILTLGLCTAVLAEPEAIPGTGLGWELDNKGKLTISVMDSSKSLDIPNYTLHTLVDRPWFLETDNVTSIVIKSGVTRVGNWSFYETEAASIIFEEPCKVTVIGDYAFQPLHNYNDNCTSLIIPESVQSIGEYAFHDFLKCKLTFSEGITAVGSLSLGKSCFGQLNREGNSYALTLPKRLTSLGWNSFASANISSVVFPEKLTVIGPYCFHLCSNLTKIIFADASKIKQIKKYAFLSISDKVVVQNQTGSLYALKALRNSSITDPTGNTTFLNALPIGEYCGMEDSKSSMSWLFDQTTGKLIISGSGDMPDYAFYTGSRPWDQYRKNIKQIIIKSGITRVGDYAFFRAKTASITFENTAEHPSQLKSIGKYAFFQDAANKTCTSLVIPESVEEIDCCAFGTYINCKLTFLQNDAGAKTLTLGDACFAGLNWNGTAYSLKLPSRLTSVGKRCFGNAKIDSVNIPKKLTVISEDCFELCKSLQKITFEDASEVKKIEKNAFKNIPNNVVVENKTGIRYDLACLRKVTVSEGNQSFLNALPKYSAIQLTADKTSIIFKGSGKTFIRLTALTDPSGAVIDYVSSNPDIASVNKKGTVSFFKTGAVTITAAFRDTVGATASIDLYCGVDKLSSLELSANSKTVILKNGTAQIQLYTSLKPQDTIYRKVSFTSSDTDIATVSKKGLVTFHKAGTVKISAISTVDSKVYATITLKAAKDIKVTDFSVKNLKTEKHIELYTSKSKAYQNPSVVMKVGDKLDLRIINVKPENATNKKITVSVLNSKIVTMEEKPKSDAQHLVVTAKSKGTTIVKMVPQGNKNIVLYFTIRVK